MCFPSKGTKSYSQQRSELEQSRFGRLFCKFSALFDATHGEQVGDGEQADNDGNQGHLRIEIKWQWEAVRVAEQRITRGKNIQQKKDEEEMRNQKRSKTYKTKRTRKKRGRNKEEETFNVRES